MLFVLFFSLLNMNEEFSPTGRLTNPPRTTKVKYDCEGNLQEQRVVASSFILHGTRQWELASSDVSTWLHYFANRIKFFLQASNQPGWFQLLVVIEKWKFYFRLMSVCQVQLVLVTSLELFQWQARRCVTSCLWWLLSSCQRPETTLSVDVLVSRWEKR
jgi:hypothetical protein